MSPIHERRRAVLLALGLRRWFGCNSSVVALDVHTNEPLRFAGRPSEVLARGQRVPRTRIDRRALPPAGDSLRLPARNPGSALNRSLGTAWLQRTARVAGRNAPSVGPEGRRLRVVVGTSVAGCQEPMRLLAQVRRLASSPWRDLRCFTQRVVWLRRTCRELPRGGGAGVAEPTVQ